MRLSWSFITILILHWQIIFADEYGFIKGRVVNAKTKEPLRMANVVISGTDLGAATNENGEYLILYIPPGKYRVTASYIGFDVKTVSNIKVTANQTTILNFEFEPPQIIIHGDPIICEPPMIYRTRSSNMITKNADEISILPITSLEDLFQIQSGIVATDSGLHIRGGRIHNTKYYFDGIILDIPNLGAPLLNINEDIIKEVSFVTGGLNAEYGDAQSVVNIITKTGNKTRHHFALRNLTDRIFNNNKIDYGYTAPSILLDGPITKRIAYLFSGELTSTDASQQGLYKIPSPGLDYGTLGKVSFSLPNARGRIDIFGFKARKQFEYYLPDDEYGSYLKYIENRPVKRTKYGILGASILCMFNPLALGYLTLGMTSFDRLFGPRDNEWEIENKRHWYDDFRIKYEDMIELLKTKEIPAREILMNIDLRCDNNGPEALRKSPYAIDGIFYTIGDYPAWVYWNNNDLQIHSNVIYAWGKHHQFKIGADFIKYSLRYYTRTAPPISEKNYFFTLYERKPCKISGYVQDIIDLEGIVANLGMRFDFFDPQNFTYCEPLNPRNDTLLYADRILTLSPRIGFSLPITEQQKFRFSYCHYNQVPKFDYFYATSDTMVIRLILIRRNAPISNISLKPERTIAYEIGYENIFKNSLLFAGTLFHKDVSNSPELRKVIALPEPYYQYFNDGQYYIKGVEVGIVKRLEEFWGFDIRYTLQFAEGTGAWAHKSYYESDTIPPAVNYYLGYDERHNFSANFNLKTPERFFMKLLSNSTSSIQFNYHSGFPYTPEDLFGNRAGNENSERMPGYWNTDWTFGKRIRTGNFSILLYCLINNLFNTKQIIKVYPTSGNPDNPGYPEPLLDEFDYIPISSPYYSPQGDHNHDGMITPEEMRREYLSAIYDLYANPTFYRNPFRLRLGIGIEF